MMKEKLTNFVKSLDFFGVTFNFRVNKEALYSSTTGGVCFIIYIIIALLFIFQSLGEFIYRNKMVLAFIEQSINPTPELKFSENKFVFAMRLTFDNDTNIDQSEFSNFLQAEISFVKYEGNVKNKHLMRSRSCREEDFKTYSGEKLFNKVPFKNFTCFDNDLNISLYGIYTDPNKAYVEYLVKINPLYISNATLVEQIFNKFHFKLTMYFSETFNDVSSKNQPIFSKLDTVYTYLDLQFYKRVNIYFQDFVFSEDNDLLLENYRNNTYIKKHSHEEIVVTIKNRETSTVDDRLNLAKFILRGNNFRKTVKRSYQKIPEFLAIVSGFLVNLLLGLAAIMTIWNEFKARQSVMTRILKFKDIIKESNYDTLKYLKGQKNNYSDKSTGTGRNYIELNEIPQILKNDLSEKLFNDKLNSNRNSKIKRINLDENSNSLLINFKDLIYYIFCCGNIDKKKVVYENAESKFNYYLDIITYMNKMQEIDIIKYLLLDEDSLNLLNFLSKPTVSIIKPSENNKLLEKFFMNNQEHVGFTIDEANILKKSYFNLKSKEDLNLMDKKLINLFDVQVQELLN